MKYQIDLPKGQHVIYHQIYPPRLQKSDSDTIVTAPAIEEPIAKCEADVSLLADVVVSKFVDHIPEYRQQQIYKRQGVGSHHRL